MDGDHFACSTIHGHSLEYDMLFVFESSDKSTLILEVVVDETAGMFYKPGGFHRND